MNERASRQKARGTLRQCAREGCSETFLIGPKNEHQKYHSKACGEAARKRWLQPERRRYMRDFMCGYVRVEDRESTRGRSCENDDAQEEKIA